MSQQLLEAVAKIVGKKAAADVLHEAAAEVSGRSSRKWAVRLVVLMAVGVVIGLVVAPRRQVQSAAPGDQPQVPPASTPPTTAPIASQARSS